jgi:glutamate:GABA antiporter
VYFVPYLYLFAAFIVHRARAVEEPPLRVPGGMGIAGLVGISGFLVTAFAMIVAMIPPADDPDPLLFRLKVIGGAATFLLLGGVIYWRAQRVSTVR